ncbi:MAG: MFS transporter [Actinophytocola sp.]|uniref:MFS transporter n=1 Tax=Actinophytocola sp. TaxID=1872138 RepID=UPI003D6C30EF
MTSVGAMLADIQAGSGMSAVLASAVVAAPVWCFAIGGGLAYKMRTRWGTSRTVSLALVVLAATLASRVLAGPYVLLAGTVVACLAIAVLGTLLPVITHAAPAKSWALLTGCYVAAMGGGSGIGALVTPQVAGQSSWQLGVSGWALLAAAAWAAWRIASRRFVEPAIKVKKHPGPSSLEPAGTAWALTLHFGLTSGFTFSIMGWLPSVLLEYSQVDPPSVEWMFTLAMALGVPIALLVPRWARRWESQSGLAVALATPSVVAVVGLLVVPTWGPWLWSIGLGLGMPAVGLALAMISMRAAPDGDTAAALSAMVQGIGYAIAGATALACGLLHSSTQTWEWPLLALLIVLCGQILTGLHAGLPITVFAGGLPPEPAQVPAPRRPAELPPAVRRAFPPSPDRPRPSAPSPERARPFAPDRVRTDHTRPPAPDRTRPPVPVGHHTMPPAHQPMLPFPPMSAPMVPTQRSGPPTFPPGPPRPSGNEPWGSRSGQYGTPFGRFAQASRPAFAPPDQRGPQPALTEDPQTESIFPSPRRGDPTEPTVTEALKPRRGTPDEPSTDGLVPRAPEPAKADATFAVEEAPVTEALIPSPRSAEPSPSARLVAPPAAPPSSPLSAARQPVELARADATFATEERPPVTEALIPSPRAAEPTQAAPATSVRQPAAPPEADATFESEEAPEAGALIPSPRAAEPSLPPAAPRKPAEPTATEMLVRSLRGAMSSTAPPRSAEEASVPASRAAEPSVLEEPAGTEMLVPAPRPAEPSALAESPGTEVLSPAPRAGRRPAAESSALAESSGTEVLSPGPRAGQRPAAGSALAESSGTEVLSRAARRPVAESSALAESSGTEVLSRATGRPVAESSALAESPGTEVLSGTARRPVAEASALAESSGTEVLSSASRAAQQPAALNESAGTEMLAPAPRVAEQSAAEYSTVVRSALDEPTWTQMLVPAPRRAVEPSPAEQPPAVEQADVEQADVEQADVEQADVETDAEPVGVEAESKSEAEEWAGEIPEQRVGEAEPSAQEPSAVSPTHPEVEHGEAITAPANGAEPADRAEHWDSFEPIQLELALLLDSPMPDPDVFYERTIHIPHPRQPSS